MSVDELLRLEWIVLAGLVGAVVGSFLNVVIYRVPLGESIVTPRSRCPSCRELIRWYHNVPMFSWLWLRGRCARCAAPISARYPAVELLNALLWLGVALRFGPSTVGVLLLVFVSGMLALFFTDWDHQLLPDLITLPLALVGLAASPFNPLLDLAPGVIGSGTPLARLGSALAGALLGYGIFFTLALAWRVLFDREALGGGDLKMMLAVGAFLGMPGVVTTILLASIVGTLLSLPLLIGGRWTMTRELPFGCFLAPAAVLSAFYGQPLVRWYIGLLSFG
jgi:leader peptidase (prepilin peptidase)/N-methyltransferase